MSTRAGNEIYDGPSDLPPVVPVFPLAGVLLLPRRLLPLNVFEPRYLALVAAALDGDRLIGIVQPNATATAVVPSRPQLERVGCLGRLTQYAETGDGRLMIGLTGVVRFRIVEELAATTPYRLVRIDTREFVGDFEPGLGEASVDRAGLMATLDAWLEAHKLDLERSHFEEAGSEALVDGLAMMSPCGPREKQALLEAPDLAGRADLLVAITQMSLAGGGTSGPLQ